MKIHTATLTQSNAHIRYKTDTKSTVPQAIHVRCVNGNVNDGPAQCAHVRMPCLCLEPP